MEPGQGQGSGCYRDCLPFLHPRAGWRIRGWNSLTCGLIPFCDSLTLTTGYCAHAPVLKPRGCFCPTALEYLCGGTLHWPPEASLKSTSVGCGCRMQRDDYHSAERRYKIRQESQFWSFHHQNQSAQSQGSLKHTARLPGLLTPQAIRISTCSMPLFVIQPLPETAWHQPALASTDLLWPNTHLAYRTPQAPFSGKPISTSTSVPGQVEVSPELLQNGHISLWQLLDCTLAY